MMMRKTTKEIWTFSQLIEYNRVMSAFLKLFDKAIKKTVFNPIKYTKRHYLQYENDSSYFCDFLTHTFYLHTNLLY